MLRLGGPESTQHPCRTACLSPASTPRALPGPDVGRECPNLHPKAWGSWHRDLCSCCHVRLHLLQLPASAVGCAVGRQAGWVPSHAGKLTIVAGEGSLPGCAGSGGCSYVPGDGPGDHQDAHQVNKPPFMLAGGSWLGTRLAAWHGRGFYHIWGAARGCSASLSGANGTGAVLADPLMCPGSNATSLLQRWGTGWTPPAPNVLERGAGCPLCHWDD